MKHFFYSFSLLLLLSFAIFGQAPQTMSFQGVATDATGNNLADGNYQMIFKIYTSESGGGDIWNETQDVTVTDGIFNVILGEDNPLALPFDTQYWLGVRIESDQELSPRMRLTSSPYALSAATVEDGAITQDKLAPGLSLPPGGEAGGDLTGDFPNPSIANNAITSEKIKNETIVDDDIDANAAIAISKLYGDVGVDWTNFDSYPNLGTDIVSLGSVTITAPTDGYIVAYLTGGAVFFGDNTVMNIGISSTSTNYSLADGSVSLGRLDGSGTDRYYDNYSVMWAGAVIQGDVTLYAIANKISVFSAQTINLTAGKLTIIFIPKKY